MSVETTLLVVALMSGFYMAWNIGANDVANAMGTSVGAGSLTLTQAVILAAVLEFSGAFFAGSDVSETVMRGIVNPLVFEDSPKLFIYGMLGSLLAAGSWLQVASYFGWPVSTSHSIVGAILGFGLVKGGIEAVHWDTVGYIAVSWIVSPVLGGSLAFITFGILNRLIFFKAHPIRAAKKVFPWIVFVVGFLLSCYFFFKAIHVIHVPVFAGIFASFLVGTIAMVISRHFILKIRENRTSKPLGRLQDPQVLTGLDRVLKHLRRTKRIANNEVRFQIGMLHDEVKTLREGVEKRNQVEVNQSEYRDVERIFAFLQIVSAGLMAFAHGANDVANAIGPLAAVVAVLHSDSLVLPSTIPVWILCLGGGGIVIGLASWGWRVIETIGKKITALTPSRGFAAEFGAATTILLASKLGLPVSTTHTLVGAVLGVGLARGISALNLNTLRDIVISWIITVPAGAGAAFIYYFLLQKIFG